MSQPTSLVGGIAWPDTYLYYIVNYLKRRRVGV